MTGRLAVELFGLPGAGKSTLAAEVVALVRARGLPIHEPAPRTRLGQATALARYTLTHPGYAVRSLREILASDQRSRDDLRWVLATWLKRSSRLDAARRAPGVDVQDAGILQALWSIAFSARSPDVAGMLARLRAAMPLPDHVVVVRASRTTVARRLAGRPVHHSRLEHAADANDDAIARAADLVDEIERALATVGPAIAIHAVDNDADAALARNAHTIADAIETAWTGERRVPAPRSR